MEQTLLLDIRSTPRASPSLRTVVVATAALVATAIAVRSRSVVRVAQQLYVSAPGRGNLDATFDADMAVCWNYDDDSQYLVSAQYCGPYDKAKFCTWSENKVSRRFQSLCGASCDDPRGDNSTWAMVCAWEAVANLRSACAGEFVPTINVSSANAASPENVSLTGTARDGGDDAAAPVAPAPLGTAARMYNCDEHALCLGCAQGDARFCRAVSSFYGGPGVPYKYNGTGWGFAWFSGHEYVGADAAFNAINNDWRWWCHEDTLAQIEAGEFNQTAAWVSYKGFWMATKHLDRR